MNLFLATTNAGKLRDFAAAVTPGVVLAVLPGLASMAVPVEDAPTFDGNARIKAVAYSRAAPGLLVLADDSGLEVDALGGEPGVRSARFAEDRGFTEGATTDARNNGCLLAAMTRQTVRTGRYRCVLALGYNGQVLATAAGYVEGEILAEARGAGGFGYDPLFLLAEAGATMAEVGMEARLGYSHRGRALARLLSMIVHPSGSA